VEPSLIGPALDGVVRRAFGHPTQPLLLHIPLNLDHVGVGDGNAVEQDRAEHFVIGQRILKFGVEAQQPRGVFEVRQELALVVGHGVA
jgi:hypothetical protein